MKLTEEQCELIFDCGVNQITTDDGEVFDVSEKSEWSGDGGKYEAAHIILRKQSDSKYYKTTNWRSGSYYTDYSYGEWSKLIEVVSVEKIVIEWEVVGIT